MARTGELTLKQQRFVEEYLKDGNATRAAKAAGYSPKTAKSIATENLSKLAVQAAIREAQQRQQETAGVPMQAIVETLAAIGFAEVGEPIKLAHKLKALELLVRHVSLTDLDRRIAALEAMAQKGGVWPRWRSA